MPILIILAATINLPAAGYEAVMLPANIAPTPSTSSSDPAKVFGTPKMVTSHPNTLWDQEDIDTLKETLKTDTVLQDRLTKLKEEMNTRIAQPLGVPEPGKNQPTGEGWRNHKANAETISKLGILYVLTGDAKYAEFCRKMLVAYAQGYPTYQHTEGWTINKYRSAHDGRLTGQFLEDGFWVCWAAFGYDLVYNLPSWIEEERKLVKTDLFEAICKQFYDPVLKDTDYVSALHNRSVLCMSGQLMAGYATENETLVNIALYGQGGNAENIKGGIIGTHFGPKCILPDGLWIEGAPGYQVGIASCGLFNAAETLWHHGIDMYSFNNGVLKRLLDSPFGLAFPDKKITVPALHDSSVFALLDDRDWFNNEAGIPYECGYRRYKDPRYLPVIRNARQEIKMTIHAGPPSLFLDLPSESEAPQRSFESANFHSVGYGVLRVMTPTGGNQLIMEYGPNAGHAHPSKLGIDFYALGASLMPFPGVIFPYQDPMDPKWYWTTLGNCALTIDEKNQIYSGNRWLFPRTLPEPDATQLVYGPSATMGIQKAWSKTVYPGVTQDRALFLTPQYLADIFLAFSDTPHKYDLAWHFRGKLKMGLNMEPYQFPEPVTNGYNALTEVMRAPATDAAWSASVMTGGNKPVKFFAAGGIQTEVITGNGHFFINSPKNDEFPPTIIQRRDKQSNVLFGNVTDVSGSPDSYVKSVVQEGGVEAGYGLLKIETVKGTDLCFAGYDNQAHKAGGLETDAQMAFVVRNGSDIQSLYLGGGKSLNVGPASITRSEAGLAYVEKLDTGSFIVANPSPAEATVSVSLPGIDKLDVYQLDADGKRLKAAAVTRDAASQTVTIQLKAASKVEFVPKK